MWIKFNCFLDAPKDRKRPAPDSARSSGKMVCRVNFAALIWLANLDRPASSCRPTEVRRKTNLLERIISRSGRLLGVCWQASLPS